MGLPDPEAQTASVEHQSSLGSPAEEAGFTPPYREGLHPEQQASPGCLLCLWCLLCVTLSPLLTPGRRPTPTHGAWSQPRPGAKQAGLRSRSLGQSHHQHWQTHSLGLHFSCKIKPVFKFYWEKKEDFSTSSWCFAYV